MNWDQVITAVQNLRAQLDVWGVSASGLLLTGSIAFIIFVFALREVLTWYLRIGEMRSQLKKLSEEISYLQSMVRENCVAKQPLVAAAAEADNDVALASGDSKPTPARKSSRFRFDH